MKEMPDLSFPFIMDLYRIKEKALQRQDDKAIENLKKNYSFIFTENFEAFIENLKAAIDHLDIEHGTNFKEMLVIEKDSNVLH
jgi:hypothetical protein